MLAISQILKGTSKDDFSEAQVMIGMRSVSVDVSKGLMTLSLNDD